MKKLLKPAFRLFALMLLVLIVSRCGNNENKHRTDEAPATEDITTIPDSVVHFLITSSADDFHNHQPPKAVDFRNVRIGYLSNSGSERTYLLCGEFLAEESKEWIEFTTLKTSGYELYIGKSTYCQDAILVLTDGQLSRELKATYEQLK